MPLRAALFCSLVFGLGSPAVAEAPARSSVRVATYNLRNYLPMDRLVEGRFRRDYPKPESEKKVLRETILEAGADLIVLQEIACVAHLEELQMDLASLGLLYEGSCVLEAEDDLRRIAALWKGDLNLQPVEHLDLEFSLFGERMAVKRGMLELRFSSPAAANLRSVFVLHLKSRYTDDARDPQSRERRAREARAARDRILELYPDPASSPFLVVGDLNDQRHSPAVRRLRKRGETRISEILDIRDRHGLLWTHYFKKAGEYSLADYVLCSPAFEPSVVDSGIVDRKDFYEGSDHRLVWVDLRLDQPRKLQAF